MEIAKLLLEAGVGKTDKSKEYVHKIGERFEFIRPDFNKELVAGEKCFSRAEEGTWSA